MAEEDKGTGDGGDGDKGTDWRASLPEDLRESPALKDVKDVGSLAKQFVDSQQYIGSAIRIPSEDAGEEAVKEFRQKLTKVPGVTIINPDDDESFKDAMAKFGALDDPDKYEPPAFEGMPEGMEPSPLLGVLKTAAVEGRMTPKQFQTVARKFTEAELAKANEWNENHNKETKALKDEWGQAFDEKKSSAIRAAELTAAPEAMIEAMKAGNVRAEVYRWMASVADKLGKDFKAGGNEQQQTVTMTPAEAGARIAEIEGNKEHAYWTAPVGSPEKNRAVEQMLELRRLARGNNNPVVFQTGQRRNNAA